MKTLRSRLLLIAIGSVTWSWAAHPGEVLHHILTLCFVLGLGCAGIISYLYPGKYL